MTERYFHDSIYEDTPEFAVFGPDTWGLVDEEQGGVVAYFHENNAPMFAHLIDHAQRDPLIELREWASTVSQFMAEDKSNDWSEEIAQLEAIEERLTTALTEKEI